MALTDEMGGTGMVMPVSPMYGGGNGFGNGFGGDGWWILLLFILLGNGAWGNNMGGGFGGNGLYPWMNQSNQISDGFRDQMMNSTINGIQSSVTSGFGDVQNALCSGFAGVNAGIANGFAQSEISANARQMADMQQNFALQSQLAQCCCDNRAATADLKYTVATEACADRAAVSNGIRDVIENCNRNNQAVLDKLCALELDGVKNQLAQAQRENVGLQNQLNMATLRESQTAQNAFIQQGLTNEVDALYNRLSNCPVPSVPVYGRQPIFSCGNNSGCGCGGNAFVN